MSSILRQWIWLFILLLLLYAISAQAQSTSQATPWTMGVDLAVPVIPERTDLKYSQSSFNRTTYKRIGGRAGYRIFRWLSLDAQTQYHQASIFRHATSSNTTQQPYSYTIRQRQQILSTSIGPSLLGRIRQGDVFLSMQFGAAVHFNKQSGLRNDGVQINSNYLPSFSKVILTEIGYTYWPTRQLGVRLALQNQIIQTVLGRSNQLTPRKITSSSQNFSLDQLEGAQFFHSIRDEVNYVYKLSVGVEYRFFR